MSERMSDRMSECMPENMSNIYIHAICHMYIQAVCQNSVSGSGSLEESNLFFGTITAVLDKSLEILYSLSFEHCSSYWRLHHQYL